MAGLLGSQMRLTSRNAPLITPRTSKSLPRPHRRCAYDTLYIITTITPPHPHAMRGILFFLADFTAPRAAIDFSAAPLEVLIGGGAFVLSTAGYLVYEAMKASGIQGLPTGASPTSAATPPPPLPRENAVVVFGASGRTGRQVVAELLKSGRTVVAAVRDEARALEAFKAVGITAAGRQPPSINSTAILFIQPNIDVTSPDTLMSDTLFTGASQVICTLGPIFGRTADGAMGYLDNMTSERVDNMGVTNVATAAAKYLSSSSSSSSVVSKTILPMSTAEDLATWQRLDDVIMGGASSSTLSFTSDIDEGGSVVSWKGQLIVEGGGFCGARTQPLSLDLSSYDGVVLRVRSEGGDQKTLKLNIKTDTFIEPEDTYQASFTTAPNGDWTTVFLPWSQFVPVKRAKTVVNGPPLDPSKIRQFGLVYSRFSFNGFPNTKYAPGAFEFQFKDGIGAYVAPRPQILLVSSAAVERNAKIGDDEEGRKKDIPIVQLNPGGTLNHKYSGEISVRGSGLSYSVIRATGMSDDVGEKGPALLEFGQGDRMSGKVGRSDIAAVVAAAAGLPAAANKTIEVRRSEAGDAQGREMTRQDTLRLFLSAVEDEKRQTIGLEPFPAPAPLPPAPSETRKNEILADPRVQEARDRGAGGRVRSGEETKGVTLVTAVDDGRAQASSSADDGDGDSGSSLTPQKQQDEVPANVREAREWIRKYRARSLERQLPQNVANL